MRNIMLALPVLIAYWNVAGVVQAAPINIPESGPPKIDGIVDDDCWRTATKLDVLHLAGADPAKASDETTFRLCRDDAWLYIAVQCSNPDMPHVEQTVFAHDGPVQKDESVEIFIDPGTDGKNVRHFMLNFAGVQTEKTFGLSGANPRVNWGCPWRVAVRRLPAGWEAEMAIPLYALQGGRLDDTRINLLRNRIVPEIDEMGAKQGERREYYVLAAAQNAKDASGYLPVAGLDDQPAVQPFAPRIDGVELGGFDEDATGYSYNMTLSLSTATRIGGTADVWVIETRDGAAVEHQCRPVELPRENKVVVSVPLNDFNERAIRVILRDQGGSLLAAAAVPDSRHLAIVRDAFVGRSYYTTETNAELRIALGAPDRMRAKISLRVTAAGQTVFEQAQPDPELTAVVPLAGLAFGRNPVHLSIMDAGREIYGADYEIIKLAPRPGCEVKADYIRKVLLKDGVPFFPLAMIAHHIRHERHFQKLAELGFNTVQICNVGDQPELVDLAAKHGLYVMDWGLNKIDIKAWDGLPAARTNYANMLPKYRQAAQALADRTNFLMRFQVDEPNLDAADVNLQAMKWFYNDMLAVDPYRPFLLNFSKYLPPGKEWTAYAEALSDDIYPRPWTGVGLLAEPGLGQAYYAEKLRQRCEQDHKLMFMVPLAGQHSIQKGQVGLSRRQTLCQNYVNLIFGVKCLDFFCITTPSSAAAWDDLGELCAQVKQLIPALIHDEVAQNVQYPGQAYDPAGALFPQVLGRVFQYPDGHYVLLAANLRHFAAEVGFQLPGVMGATPMFDARERLAAADGVFHERLEPFGTRAYRLDGELKTPLALAITPRSDESEQAPSVDIPGVIQRVQAGKNHCPNPCFERQLIPGSPDFYKPFINQDDEIDYNFTRTGSVWYVDADMRWNGHPSLRMDRSQPCPKSRGFFGACYPPIPDQPEQMVFSFYARGAKAGDRVLANLMTLSRPVEVRKTFDLTTEWQRIVMPFTLHPRPDGRSVPVRTFIVMPLDGAEVWVSGLQLEKGGKPTEFQDDSGY